MQRRKSFFMAGVLICTLLTASLPGISAQAEEVTDSTEVSDSTEMTVDSSLLMGDIFTTAVSSDSVKLQWEAVEGATGYEIYKLQEDYELLATVTDSFYRDDTAAYGSVHKYKIVPLGDNNTCGEAAYVTFDHRKIMSITGKKYSYTAMKNDIEDLEKAYSDYCHVNVFGTSTKGRNLYDVVIGNPNAEKSVLVVSTLHAREYVCSALMMRQIEYYLKNYNGTINGMVPSEVLNDVQIHYVVMANPDGVVISQNSYKRWKANARGVDLNRNFPYKFRVRGKKGAEGFSGSKAASEKETKAIIKLCKNLKSTTSLKSVINYHAMGQIIFGDYSGSNSKVKKETTSLYHLARKLTGYKSAASYNSTGYGNFREYVMYGMKIPSITIEVGRTTCPCNFSEYGSIFTKNKNLLLSVAKRY